MKYHLAAAAFVALSLSPVHAGAQDRVELGLLDCSVEGGIGMLLGSTKDMTCTFNSADGSRPPEVYFGIVNKIGIDIGVTGATVLQWLVLAPTGDAYAPGALAGGYVGAGVEATAGVGVGANVLIGGSNETVTLQPVSVQAQTGVNVAAGITEIQLRSTAN